MNIEEKLRATIRDVKDFPKEGIVFKDITPIMMDPLLSKELVDELYSMYKDEELDAVAGIESRGFLFGYPLAMRLGVPFVLIRKKGKLPYDKISHDYDLEYVSSFSKEFDQFFLKVSKDWDFIFSKTSKHLNWRFCENPENYSIILIKKDLIIH